MSKAMILAMILYIFVAINLMIFSGAIIFKICSFIFSEYLSFELMILYLVIVFYCAIQLLFKILDALDPEKHKGV